MIASLALSSALLGCGRTSSDSSSEMIPWPGYAREEAGDVAFRYGPDEWVIEDDELRDRIIEAVWNLELATSVTLDGPITLGEDFAIVVDIEPRGSVRVVGGPSGEGFWTARRTGAGHWHGKFTAACEGRIEALWREIMDATRDTDPSTEHE